MLEDGYVDYILDGQTFDLEGVRSMRENIFFKSSLSSMEGSLALILSSCDLTSSGSTVVVKSVRIFIKGSSSR